jgi:hypothetical protein
VEHVFKKKSEVKSRLNVHLLLPSIQKFGGEDEDEDGDENEDEDEDEVIKEIRKEPDGPVDSEEKSLESKFLYEMKKIQGWFNPEASRILNH